MTAVEWILIELQKNFPKEIHNAYNANQLLFESLFQQAKAMEKEQIINAHGEDRSYLQDDGSWKRINGEQYYNETYGSQGSNDTTSPNN
jgi:hypothetical protein